MSKNLSFVLGTGVFRKQTITLNHILYELLNYLLVKISIMDEIVFIILV
jgi:hypothetical protein